MEILFAMPPQKWQNKLRWFGQIQWRLVDATTKKSDKIIVKEKSREREKPRLIWDVVVIKDMILLNLPALARAECWKKIHIAYANWLRHET